MSNVLVQPARAESGDDSQYRLVKQITGYLAGETDWRVAVTQTANDDANYAVTIENFGAGGKHLNIPGILVADATGVSIGTLSLTNLIVSGTSTLNIVNASGLVTLSKAGLALVVTNNATVGGTLGVTGVSTLGTVNAGTATVTALTATGNVALGDANTDAHTVIGVTTFRNAANTATQGVFDPGNNRVVLLSSTALGSDTTPALHVVGRLYVAPESANDHAIQVRRSSAATNGWWIGATADPNGDLVFKDDGDTERFRVGDASSTDQAVVTGRMTVSNGLVISASGANITGGITVSTGGVTVLAGGITVTGTTTFHSGFTLDGPSNIDGNGGTAGQIRIGAVIVNDTALTSTEKLKVTGSALISSTLTLNGELSAKAPVVGAASGNLTLTSSYQDISGCSVSLTPGNWLVTGFFFMAESGAGDLNQDLTGRLVTTGGTATISNSSSIAVFTPETANQTATVGQAWAVNVTATTTAKLQAKKLAGTGASVAGATQTTITAVFVGKP